MTYLKKRDKMRPVQLLSGKRDTKWKYGTPYISMQLNYSEQLH